MMHAIFHALCAALALTVAAIPWLPAAHAQAGDEVPFITTPDNVTLEMLRLAGVGPRDHVIDLGSGDGRIVITAARRFGASGLGVELVAELVARSRATAARAGVGRRAEFREQDLFKTDLSKASVITMYLLPEVNLQLRPSLLALAPGTRIVSHDWDMAEWLPDRSVVVDAPDKTIGLEKRSKVHLWVVPARMQGVWCGAGGALEIVQRFQLVDAAWRGGATSSAAPSWPLQGRLDGASLRLLGAGGTALQAQARERELVVSAASGALRQLQGQRLTRTDRPACR